MYSWKRACNLLNVIKLLDVTSVEWIKTYSGEFQMKIFSKVLLAGTLALGGLAAMNVETPKIHADEASEYCRYIYILKKH